MRVCASCGAVLPDDWLDVYCARPCLDRLYEQLAAVLVGSKGRSLAAEHWARRAWWRRSRAVPSWRAAS